MYRFLTSEEIDFSSSNLILFQGEEAVHDYYLSNPEDLLEKLPLY